MMEALAFWNAIEQQGSQCTSVISTCHNSVPDLLAKLYRPWGLPKVTTVPPDSAPRHHVERRPWCRSHCWYAGGGEVEDGVAQFGDRAGGQEGRTETATIGEHAVQGDAEVDRPGHRGQHVVVVSQVEHLLFPERAPWDVVEAAANR